MKTKRTPTHAIEVTGGIMGWLFTPLFLYGAIGNWFIPMHNHWIATFLMGMGVFVGLAAILEYRQYRKDLKSEFYKKLTD